MKLTVVRHGETYANRDRITQGQLDSKLTETGHAQAAEVASVLSDETFHRILSSDLSRCVDTAFKIVAHHPDTPIEHHEDLREYSFGEHQGKPTDSWDWPDTIDNTDTDAKAPGGESAREVTRRIIRPLNRLYEEDNNQHVLVVTHGGVIRLLRVLLGEIEFHERMQHKIGNCSIWRFTLEEPLKELE